MTKIEALLRRILLLKETRPQEKSLVFSSFEDALDLVGQALRENEVGFERLSGNVKVPPPAAPPNAAGHLKACCESC